MRVLFVLENYYPNIGGVETLFKSLIDQLLAGGHECIVITSRLRPADPLLETSGALTVVRIPVANRYLFTFKALWAVFQHIKSCDLVQTTSYNAALPAFIGAVCYRKKVLVTFHEVWGKLWFDLPYMSRVGKVAHYLFEQLLLRLPFHRFIAVSQSTARRLQEEGIAARRIITIYNGIDYAEFREVTPVEKKNDYFTFTYFGRLGISKGLDLLLEAAMVIKASLPDCRLQLIVPTTPPAFLTMVKELIRQNELEDVVSFRHHLPFSDLKAAIRASDCVVIPSYSEGFCFAAVETVALGTPIVSSGRAALAEVVSGRFVEMETLSVKALVEAMQKAYRGEWKESPIRRFALQDTVAAYVATYREVLSNEL